MHIEGYTDSALVGKYIRFELDDKYVDASVWMDIPVKEDGTFSTESLISSNKDPYINYLHWGTSLAPKTLYLRQLEVCKLGL